MIGGIFLASKGELGNDQVQTLRKVFNIPVKRTRAFHPIAIQSRIFFK